MATSVERKSCGFLGCESASNQRCSRCKNIYYCSIKHQKEDWLSHKQYCVSLKSATEAAIERATISCNNFTDSSGSSSSHRREEKSVATTQNKSAPEEFLTEDEATTKGTTEGESEKRTGRCMFCGEELILGSEDDAVNHMRECVALQEQLASKDQFTIPTMLREQNNL